MSDLPARINDLLSPIETKGGRYQRALLTFVQQHRRHEARHPGTSLPTSLRFLIYEGIQNSDWPKHYDPAKDGPVRRTPAQDVTDALTHLREVGLVEWDEIVDETRDVSDWRSGRTIVECVLDFLPVARITPWEGLPPLVICESRSLRGVLEVLLAEYLTSVTSTNGQVRGHLHTKVGPMLDNDRRVLYLGDWDWQGGQIERHTRRRLEEITRRTFDETSWRRVALTEAQVGEYDLVRKNKIDERYNDKTPREAVETESLKQHVIVGIVRAELDALLPEPLDTVLVREERERRCVRRALERLNDAS